MTRSAEFVRSAFASETDEIWLILLTISHADLTDDIRVVHNTENVTSRRRPVRRLRFRAVAAARFSRAPAGCGATD